MNKSRFWLALILICFNHVSFAAKCLDEVRANVQSQIDTLVTPEFVKGKINAFIYEKALKDFKKSRGLAENTEIAQRQINVFNKRFQYCTKASNNKLNLKSTSVFGKLTTQYSMALSIGSYITLQLDKEKNSHWFKNLGFEIVSAYAFSKIPGLVMRNSKSSDIIKMVKELGTNLSFDYGVTRLYAELLAPEDHVVNYKLDKESQKELDKKLMEIISTPKFQELLKNYYTEFQKYLTDDNGVNETAILQAVQADPELKALLEQNYLKVKNSLQKKQFAEDMFEYDTIYAISSTGPKVFMYDQIVKLICLGYPRASIGLFVMFRILSSMTYFKGRSLYMQAAPSPTSTPNRDK